MGLLDAYADPQDASPGFFGTSVMDPRTSGILGLAAGLMQHSPAAGLQAYAAATGPEARLKQAAMRQQLAIGNLGLQQQAQEWAAIQPALAAFASRQGSAAPTTSQPAIAPSSGGPLGSGTAGIPMGGQPAQSGSGASGSSDPFSLDNILQGRVIGMFGGAPAGAAYWEQFKRPDAVKTNEYYGLPKDAVQQSMLRDMATKGQTLVRNGSTLGTTTPDGVFHPMFTAPDTKDNANITWTPNGPVANQIPGLTASVASVARARTEGEGSALPYAGLDASGRPLPVTNRTAAATQGAPTNMGQAQFNNDPTVKQFAQAQPDGAMILKTEYGGDPAKVQADIANIAQAIQQAPNGTVKSILQGRLNTLNAAAQSASGGGSQSAPPASGAIYAAPPLGTQANADVSQKASGQTMHDSYSRLQSTGATANAALDAIAKMQDLAAKKWPYLQAGPLGTKTTMISPDASEYEKQRANVIALMAQQLGASGTDAGRANISESVPDYGKPQAAIKDGLGTLQNQLVAQQIKRQLLTPIYQAGDSKQYATAETQFDQNVSPSMVPLLTMQGGPQRAAALQAASKDPTMRARLNWAAENGLLK